MRVVTSTSPVTDATAVTTEDTETKAEDRLRQEAWAHINRMADEFGARTLGLEDFIRDNAGIVRTLLHLVGCHNDSVDALKVALKLHPSTDALSVETPVGRVTRSRKGDAVSFDVSGIRADILAIPGVVTKVDVPKIKELVEIGRIPEGAVQDWAITVEAGCGSSSVRGATRVSKMDSVKALLPGPK